MNRSELIGDIAGEISKVLGEKDKDDDLTPDEITTVRECVDSVLDDAEKCIEDENDEPKD